MDENVSTTALIAREQLPFLLRDAFKKLGEEIKKAVKDEYETRRKTYGNSPTTIVYKGMGKTALEETGALKQAVTTWDESEIKITQLGSDYKLEVDWTLPTSLNTGAMPAGRKNNQYVYLWAHEYGTNTKITHILARNQKSFVLIKAKKPWALEPRPFFMDGIEKGINKGTEVAAGEIYVATDVKTISQRAPYVSTGVAGQPLIPTPGVTPIKLPTPIGMGGILPKLYPTSMSGLIWYVLPPSQFYAVIGMASDIAGFLRGSFFSFGMAGGYARQVAWGQVGTTKKIYRRKIRGRIWYGD